MMLSVAQITMILLVWVSDLVLHTEGGKQADGV